MESLWNSCTGWCCVSLTKLTHQWTTGPLPRSLVTVFLSLHGFALTVQCDVIGLQKKLAPIFIQSEVNQNQLWVSLRRFPALRVSYALSRWVLIGSLYCRCRMWLARMVTLVLVIWHPIENCSMFVIFLRRLIYKR